MLHPDQQLGSLLWLGISKLFSIPDQLSGFGIVAALFGRRQTIISITALTKMCCAKFVCSHRFPRFNSLQQVCCLGSEQNTFLEVALEPREGKNLLQTQPSLCLSLSIFSSLSLARTTSTTSSTCSPAKKTMVANQKPFLKCTIASYLRNNF